MLPADGPVLESPGAREGLRAEQGLLGSGAAACAAGWEPSAREARGVRCGSLHHGRLPCVPAAPCLLTAGADGRNRLNRLRLFPTEQK